MHIYIHPASAKSSSEQESVISYSVNILLQMFPLMKTFAIIGILLVNVYSKKKALVVDVGDERSKEDDAPELSGSEGDVGQGNFTSFEHCA